MKIKNNQKISAIQKIAKKNEKEIIKLCANLPDQRKTIKATSLKFVDILYLSVLFHAAEKREGDTIYGLKQDRLLFPLDNGILFVHLLKKKIISLNPSEPYKSVKFENKKIINIDLHKEAWIVNIDLGLCFIALHHAWINSTKVHPALMDKWKSHLRKVWLDITLYEAIEFMMIKLFEYGLILNISMKLKSLLLKLLDTLSAGQAFKIVNEICYSCIFHFEKLEENNEEKINNFIMEELELANVKLKKGELLLAQIDRPAICTRSLISHVFFNDHYKFSGDEAFEYFPYHL